MKLHQSKKVLVLAAVVAGALVSNCGLNPFGSGEAGIKVFANLGKALSKPAQINDQQGSKTSNKETLAQAAAMTARLGKSAAFDPIWVTDRGITDNLNGTFTYWEVVAKKPSEEDRQKLMTGRAEVVFGYTGTPTLGTIDTAKITSLNSFAFRGHDEKTWSGQTDTMSLSIAFLNPDAKDLKPGVITAWAKNISALQTNGAGDTAAFVLDSLDDIKHIQYGEGHFYDAHSGRLDDGEPRCFDFELEVHHLNKIDPSKPYLRYQDNEGVVRFSVKWTNNDSLYFRVHFFNVHERDGEIRKDSQEGPVVATFSYNEKLRSGKVIYYNDEGKEISREIW